MEQTLFEGLVETDYGQFDLVWSNEGAFDGDWERSFAGHTNGLVGSANPDGVYVTTVTIELPADQRHIAPPLRRP
jgi:hypothetical protein